MTDRRERPWKKLRVVVEVTVPPTSRAKEKDLAYMVESRLYGACVISPGGKENPLRVKSFSKFWPVFRRLELGLKPHGRPKNDPNKGL